MKTGRMPRRRSPDGNLTEQTPAGRAALQPHPMGKEEVRRLVERVRDADAMQDRPRGPDGKYRKGG